MASFNTFLVALATLFATVGGAALWPVGRSHNPTAMITHAASAMAGAIALQVKGSR